MVVVAGERWEECALDCTKRSPVANMNLVRESGMNSGSLRLAGDKTKGTQLCLTWRQPIQTHCASSTQLRTAKIALKTSNRSIKPADVNKSLTRTSACTRNYQFWQSFRKGSTGNRLHVSRHELQNRCS